MLLKARHDALLRPWESSSDNVVVGATVALGYAFGTPLLYGGSTIPVALPTGLSLPLED